MSSIALTRRSYAVRSLTRSVRGVLLIVATLLATTAFGMAVRYGGAWLSKGDAVLAHVRQGFADGSLVPDDRPSGGACPFETYHGPDGYSDCVVLGEAVALSRGPLSGAHTPHFVHGMGEPMCPLLKRAVLQNDADVVAEGGQFRYWALYDSVAAVLLARTSVLDMRAFLAAVVVASHLLVIVLALRARAWQLAVLPSCSLLLSGLPFYATSIVHSVPQTTANLCAAVCLVLFHRARWRLPLARLGAAYAAAGAVLWMFDSLSGAGLYGIVLLLTLVVFRHRGSPLHAVVSGAVGAGCLALGLVWGLAGRAAVEYAVTGQIQEIVGQVNYRAGAHAAPFLTVLSNNYSCQLPGIRLSTLCIPLDPDVASWVAWCAKVTAVVSAVSVVLFWRSRRWVPVCLMAAVFCVHPVWYYYFNNHLCAHSFFMGRYVFIVPTVTLLVVLSFAAELRLWLREFTSADTARRERGAAGP